MPFSFGEMVLIGLIAFLVLGPEDFIRMAYKAGKFLAKARDQFNNFKIMAEEEVMAADLKASLEAKAKKLAETVDLSKKDTPGE